MWFTRVDTFFAIGTTVSAAITLLHGLYSENAYSWIFFAALESDFDSVAWRNFSCWILTCFHAHLTHVLVPQGLVRNRQKLVCFQNSHYIITKLLSIAALNIFNHFFLLSVSAIISSEIPLPSCVSLYLISFLYLNCSPLTLTYSLLKPIQLESLTLRVKMTSHFWLRSSPTRPMLASERFSPSPAPTPCAVFCRVQRWPPNLFRWSFDSFSS